jgi:S-adenosylmethionine synthetase
MEVEGYDLTPKGIIKTLKLNKPIFEITSEWGHFGNGFSWDK